MTQQHILNIVVGTGITLLIAGFIYDDMPHDKPVSLAERCAERGGEWLYRSANLICIMPGGEWLSYSAAKDDFVRRDGTVASADGPPVVQAASAVGSAVAGDCAEQPKPEQYAVNTSFGGRPRVDFSTNPDAEKYRTAIRRDVDAGVNYAGKYVFAYWGCGDSCKGSAVVNAESGEIISYGMQASTYDFDTESRLLVVNGDEYYVIDQKDGQEELIPLCAESA